MFYYLWLMIPIIIIAISILFISLYFIIPRGTNLHEILRLPYYNYKAQTVRRDDMNIEKHSFGSHRRQYLVFFTPKNKKTSKDKVILYFHGGGWSFGSPMMFRCNAQFFVDLGYTVVMASHRRLPFFRSPDLKKDTELALQKTVAILDNNNHKNQELIISGLSSGGHLAGLLAYDKGIWERLKIPRERLAGIMFFAAPLDLSKMAKTPVIWRLAGLRGSAIFKKANPVSFIDANKKTPVPVLLIHGTKDGIVNYKSALSFVEKRGAEHLVFHTIKNGTHLDSGFWIFENGETREVVLEWLKQNG